MRTLIDHLSVQAAIFHPARQIVNILTLVIKADSLRNESYGKYK